jgi:hypothetical protein
MVPQIVASERHTGSSGDPDKTVGESRVTLAVMVPKYIGRCDVPGCAYKCADRRDHDCVPAKPFPLVR